MRLKIFALIASMIFIGGLVTMGTWVHGSHGSERPLVKEAGPVTGGGCC